LRLSLRSLTVGLAALGLASAAQANAPFAKTQAPAFYRFTLGAFEVTAISDGTVKLPMGKLLAGKPGANTAILKEHFLDEVVDTSVNTYLVNTGTKLVLIDTGAASLFGPTLGNFVANLKAAGYTPEQIDEVYITHAHGDHIGGLISGGALAFPNATLRVDQADLDFWLDEARAKAAPEEAKGSFMGVQASYGPWVAAKKISPFTGPTELVPGVKAVPTHGHTAGHAIYVVESEGKKLALGGDLMHVEAVQFKDPSVTIAFDTDAKAAYAERKKSFAEAAKEGFLVGFTHISFPGLGHIKAAGKGYEWMPLSYASGK
jgi:glyoxylase-like metal-dependent hydrolase (beta-lactamase superfamily II)